MTEWRNRPVTELCTDIIDCVNKTAPSSETRSPFKMLRTTNVRSGWVDTNKVRYVTEVTFERWTRRMRPRRGDIILTREAPLGEVGILRTDETVFLGQRLVMYRPDESECDPRFLLYSLLGPTVQAELRSLGSGATVEHLRVPDCERLSIPCPSLAVQKRIGFVLGSLDDLIENNKRRVQVLEEIVRSTYHEWFVRFRFPGHTDVPLIDSPVGPIPEEWHAGTLGEVIELKYGKALKADSRKGGDAAVVGSSGIVGWHDQGFVAGPVIVLGRKGNVGSVTWIDGPCWPIDTTYFVESALPLRFVVEQLRRTEFLNTHAAVPGLSRDHAYSKPFLRPPDGLMAEFARMSEVLATESSALQQQNQYLASMRDLLLPKLVTGRLDVSGIHLVGLAEGVVA